MNLVGKIQRCAAEGYVDDLAAWREHVDPVLEEIDADAI
jgi:hypothetical protein